MDNSNTTNHSTSGDSDDANHSTLQVQEHKQYNILGRGGHESTGGGRGGRGGGTLAIQPHQQQHQQQHQHHGIQPHQQQHQMQPTMRIVQQFTQAFQPMSGGRHPTGSMTHAQMMQTNRMQFQTGMPMMGMQPTIQHTRAMTVVNMNHPPGYPQAHTHQWQEQWSMGMPHVMPNYGSFPHSSHVPHSQARAFPNMQQQQHMQYMASSSQGAGISNRGPNGQQALPFSQLPALAAPPAEKDKDMKIQQNRQSNPSPLLQAEGTSQAPTKDSEKQPIHVQKQQPKVQNQPKDAQKQVRAQKKEERPSPSNPTKPSTSPKTDGAADSSKVYLKGIASRAAPGCPPGWVVKTFQRVSGPSKGRVESYWYSPCQKRKFQSMHEVSRFLEAEKLNPSNNGVVAANLTEEKKTALPRKGFDDSTTTTNAQTHPLPAEKKSVEETSTSILPTVDRDTKGVKLTPAKRGRGRGRGAGILTKEDSVVAQDPLLTESSRGRGRGRGGAAGRQNKTNLDAPPKQLFVDPFQFSPPAEKVIMNSEPETEEESPTKRWGRPRKNTVTSRPEVPVRSVSPWQKKLKIEATTPLSKIKPGRKPKTVVSNQPAGLTPQKVGRTKKDIPSQTLQKVSTKRLNAKKEAKVKASPKIKAESPSPRKRGRPFKKITPQNDNYSPRNKKSKLSVSPETSSDTPRKKRGRPRKNLLPATAEAKTTLSAGSAKKVRPSNSTDAKFSSRLRGSESIQDADPTPSKYHFRRRRPQAIAPPKNYILIERIDTKSKRRNSVATTDSKRIMKGKSVSPKKKIVTPKKNPTRNILSEQPSIKCDFECPKGWTMKVIERMGGITKGMKDRYYFSPKNNIKLRSRTEVKKFVDFLTETNGDEDAALMYLRNPSKINRTRTSSRKSI